MPRAADGTYTLVAGNPVTKGQPIAATWANPTLTDIATTLTDSLDRNGKGNITVPFKLLDGTAAAPGLCFIAESGTGLFRKAANVLGIAAGGAEVATLASSGAANVKGPLTIDPGNVATPLSLKRIGASSLVACLQIYATDGATTYDRYLGSSLGELMYGPSASLATDGALVHTSANVPVGFRNAVINPHGEIRNRAPSTISITSASFICDRWVATASGTYSGKINSSTGDGASTEYMNSPYQGKHMYITCTSSATPGSGDVVSLSQNIGAENTLDWKQGTAQAKAMVLSFVAVASHPMTIAVSVRNQDSTRSFVADVAIITTTPARYVVVIPGDTSGTWTDATTGKRMILTFAVGVGSARQTGTPGVWTSSNSLGTSGTSNLASAAGRYLRINYIQLEAAASAINPKVTPFESRPYAIEDTLCKRYYQTTYRGWAGEYPGMASLRNSADWTTAPSNSVISATPISQLRFNPPMAIIPTIATYSARTGTAGMIDWGDNVDRASEVGFVDTRKGTIRANSNTPAASLDAWVHWTADAEI